MAGTGEGSPENWLPGAWRSDRERTIEAWGQHAPGSIEFQRVLLRDLGKLEVSYDGSTSVSDFDGQRTSAPYRILWQTKDQAFVVSGAAEDESGQHLRFVSPVEYWVHVGRFVEFFRKVRDV
jgi:hypothetical protein